jgi:hypothetical protein
MSLYNLIFGKNPISSILLAIIGLKECDVERFRDCFLGDNEIQVYTRTGGGNRSDYKNLALIKNKYYKSDEDDDFDCTYATYYFNIPEEIKDDLNDFINYEKKGISAKFFQWIDATLNRPETEQDKYTKARNAQLTKISELQKEMNVSKAFNGHTIIPLSDRGMELMLKVIEDNDGEFVAYWNFLPYKFKILQNDAVWTFEKNKPDIDQDKCRIGIDIIWEIDTDVWDRYKKKFGEKYPKSIAKIQESIDRILNKE